MKHLMKVGILFVVALVGPCLSWGQTDQEIKQILIRESIASYPGTCACPYNTDTAGHSCGGRSAYSRKGGYAPLCYDKDVTQKMVDQYREAHKQKK